MQLPRIVKSEAQSSGNPCGDPLFPECWSKHQCRLDCRGKRLVFLLPLQGEKVPRGRMRGRFTPENTVRG
jgi:hypothetical protein